MKQRLTLGIATLLAVLLGLAGTAAAQGMGRGKGHGKGDGMGMGCPMGGPGMGGQGMGGALKGELFQSLYPAWLVRRNASEIGIANDQSDKLRKLINDSSAAVETLKWDVEKEAGKLGELVQKGAKKADVLKQLDAIAGIEVQIKRNHLALMLDIRDVLTPKQRGQLDAIKAKLGPFGPEMDPPWDGPGAPPVRPAKAGGAGGKPTTLPRAF